MAKTPSLSRLPLITKAGGGSNGTLDRIRRKTHATSIDSLEPLAEAFGLEPWQLLIPDLVVEAGADDRPVIQGRMVWPLDRIDMHRYLDLSDEDRAYVQGKLEQAIENCEAKSLSGDSYRQKEALPIRKRLQLADENHSDTHQKEYAQPIRAETPTQRAERQGRELMGLDHVEQGSTNRRGSKPKDR